MSKRIVKNQLKIEATKKMPDVLHKIDLESIEIIEQPEPQPKSYRQPALRLVYSMSLLLVVAIVVTVLIVGARPTPIYAKEDEAIMAASITAFSADQESASSNHNLIADLDDYIDRDAILKQLSKDIDYYLESVEINLFSKTPSRKRLKQVTDYENHLSFKSNRLSGEEVIVVMAYNEKMENNVSHVNGILLINNNEVADFTGTIKDENNKRIITIIQNQTTIRSWMEDGVRVFESTTEKLNGLIKTQVRSYLKDGNQVVEIMPQVKGIYSRKLIISKATKTTETKLEVEVIDDLEFLKFTSSIKLEITATDHDDYIEYKYHLKGKIASIIGDIDYNFNHNIKRNKRQEGR